MKTFDVQTKEGASFEVKAHHMSVTSDVCAFLNDGGLIVAAIPLSNLLYVTTKD
jgi:hypothetical protein